MVALTIEPTKPANGRKPNCLSSQTPMKAPTMPMTMFQISPKSKAAHDLPGQPAGDRADDQHDDDALDSNHDVLPFPRAPTRTAMIQLRSGQASCRLRRIKSE